MTRPHPVCTPKRTGRRSSAADTGRNDGVGRGTERRSGRKNEGRVNTVGSKQLVSEKCEWGKGTGMYIFKRPVIFKKAGEEASGTK
jgi:hypothetical protein